MPAPQGNTSGLKWTPAHDAALRRLREDGYSSSQIANYLREQFPVSYTRNAVIGRCHRLGLTDPVARFFPRVVKQRVDSPSRKLRLVHPPREEVLLRCVEIEPRHIELTDLKHKECRFPYGDGPFTFCGHPKNPGSSYCRHHLFLSIKPIATIRSRERLHASA